MDVPPFTPGNEEPGYLYLKFADFLAACIRSQKLKPGSRLPGERDFANEHGVSIGTVRRATEVLRERGLVVTLPAKGTFVAPGEPPEEAKHPQAPPEKTEAKADEPSPRAGEGSAPDNATSTPNDEARAADDEARAADDEALAAGVEPPVPKE